jgi:cytochrome c556
MKRIPLWASAALAAAGLASAVAAADMAGVVQDRQTHFKSIGKAAKAVNEALASPTPQLPAIRAYARQIDQLAAQAPSWFPAGSGPEAGVKTGAKADVWTRSADFKAAAASFAAEARKFDAVAAGGDANAVRDQFAALGKTCKTCHQSFRQKD